ncbi:hypothetical protein CM19_07155 [Candidatus Acidianus copahuensis]|uniref:Uncharacterized protein n=1 Tax=Candidatus Acidianus copahuensis TaxID=1160895 RepID=A0A031LNK0_9CREN|nr:hypothetical protein [Candidatus Acidianus copahuensis]EZQ06662.1 hypothetical protein CM19_07155 [Candidatus Acidianus copahuensis]
MEEIDWDHYTKLLPTLEGTITEFVGRLTKAGIEKVSYDIFPFDIASVVVGFQWNGYRLSISLEDIKIIHGSIKIAFRLRVSVAKEVSLKKVYYSDQELQKDLTVKSIAEEVIQTNPKEILCVLMKGYNVLRDNFKDLPTIESKC